MGRLIGPMFADSPLLALPILSLAIFLGTFLLVAARTYRRSASEYDAFAALPLGDDAPPPAEDGGER